MYFRFKICFIKKILSRWPHIQCYYWYIRHDRLDYWPVPVVADIVRWRVAWSVENATSICALLTVVTASKISILNSARGYNEIIDTELWKTMVILFVCYHIVLKIHIKCKSIAYKFLFSEKNRSLWIFMIFHTIKFERFWQRFNFYRHITAFWVSWLYV